MEGLDGIITLFHVEPEIITLGIITNGPTGLQNLTTDTLNLRQYVDCVIVSETVGIKKPDTEVYKIALTELNQSTHDVWFVGDNPATDLLGAYKMDMTTVWIRGHHDWGNQPFQPDYTVDNISELLSLSYSKII